MGSSGSRENRTREYEALFKKEFKVVVSYQPRVIKHPTTILGELYFFYYSTARNGACSFWREKSIFIFQA